VTTGEKIIFKGNNKAYYEEMKWSSFRNSTASFNLEGNIMSLIYGDNFINQINLEQDNTFDSLFAYSNVISAKNLKLPSMVLTKECYQSMFSYCT
jgi:hypothetical protein